MISSFNKALKAQKKLASSLNTAFNFATSTENPVAHVTVTTDIGASTKYYISVGLKRNASEEEKLFMPKYVDGVYVKYETTGNFKP